MRPGHGRRAAPGSAWPSFERLPRPTAARSRRATRTGAAPLLRCASRGRAAHRHLPTWSGSGRTRRALGRYRSSMSRARSIALGVVCLVGLAGCSTTPAPSRAATLTPTPSPDAPVPTEPTGPTGPTEPSLVVLDRLGGPWRPSPLVVDDAHIAIVSDACAAEARTTLGPDEAELPTALVDARG